MTDDTDSNPTGTTHTLTASVTGVAGQCESQTIEVDFEIESGPAARVNVTGDAGVGGTASDDGNTPTSPDMTCTTATLAGGPPQTGSCTVTFTSDTSGTHIVRAWIDNDRNNATVDADTSEGRNPGCLVPAGGTPDDGCAATGAQPGDRSEQDDTDVVSKTWFTALPANISLDCTPETATNPSTGTGSTETYTCTAFNDNGAGGGTASDGIRNGGEAAVSGQLIDGENLGGANDPDNSGAFAGTPDYNDACTTGADGSCTINVASSEGEAGAADICFWVDGDADNEFNGGSANDGSQCGEGQATVNSNQTDVVTKTWVAPGVAADLILSPKTDQNVKGTSHTVTATVVDAFGNPVQGALVDFTVTGRNAATANQVATNAQGQATFTYTDVGTAVVGSFQTDTITACIDQDNNNTPPATAGCDSGATTDTAQKFWFETAPTADDVIIDLTAPQTGALADGAEDCNNTDVAADKTATNLNVPDAHRICAQVLNASDQAIPGSEVTFTTSLGDFFVDTNNNGVRDTTEPLLGQTTTQNTDTNGEAFASLYSTATGTANLTVTAGSASDSGSKIFQTEEANARNIECDPATATNPTGTQHVISCTVLDRFGNPVPGVTVGAAETGAGRIDGLNPTTGITDASGEVEIIVSTVDGEEGTQSVTATITAPRDGGASNDPCEMPAGQLDASESGGPATGATPAPAGNCTVTVEKIWSDEQPPEPQCSDGIDNDGDGLVDDQDGGCYDEDGNYDPDDNDETNVTERTVHPRTVEINRFKHIKLPGKKKPALMVKGRVTVDDGFAECNNFAPVKIQLRASGEWITRKTDFTNENGVFKVLIRHVHGKYRAIATRFELFDQFGNVDVCQRAEDVRRNKH